MVKRRHRRLTPEVTKQICRLRALGMTHQQIAEVVGHAKGSVQSVLAPLGGVLRRSMFDERPVGRLTLGNRIDIYVWIREGEPFVVIAVRLGMHVSTVSREVGGVASRDVYRPMDAHSRAVDRARRPKPCKLASNPQLLAEVEAGMAKWWSPEQISKRIREAHPDDEEMRVSHETIYKSIYVQGRGELRRELARCLRSGRASRQPRGRLERRGRIPNMVSISQRPAEVEDRAVPGHWEGDLIIGEGNKSAIGTLVERTTRFVILLHLPNGYGAVQVRDAMAAKILELPEMLRRSITWDQGSEMSQHREFTIDTGVDVYFCDPHSPWQRGSNENTNGLLRQYFPKGHDLTRFDAWAVQAAADSLNERPRKTLGWATPAEALAKVIATTA